MRIVRVVGAGRSALPDRVPVVTGARWGGRAARRWTAAVLERYGTRCWLQLPGCTLTATTGDHVIPRARAPHLAYDVSNGRPACASCNRRRGVGDAPSTVIDNRSEFTP